MKRAAREWIEKAEADFISAGREYRARKKPNFDAACFFAQQCAEKYLKACLVQNDQPAPRIHDLSALLDLVLPFQPSWEMLRPGLDTLSSYAVVFRYPGESATRAMAKEAVGLVKKIRLQMRRDLRLLEDDSK
ncbi:MAG TPA: HEPN domain-containing protein [Pirellulaceae bacterium]|jgi:HEPN domain-containing protein